MRFDFLNIFFFINFIRTYVHEFFILTVLSSLKPSQTTITEVFLIFFVVFYWHDILDGFTKESAKYAHFLDIPCNKINGIGKKLLAVVKNSSRIPNLSFLVKHRNSWTFSHFYSEKSHFFMRAKYPFFCERIWKSTKILGQTSPIPGNTLLAQQKWNI